MGMDQELANDAANAPGRRFFCNHQMVALLRERSWPPSWKSDVKAKSDSVNRCVFTIYL